MKQETNSRMCLHKVCALVWAVGSRPVTTKARVRSQALTCEICGKQMAMGRVFLRQFQFFRIDIIPPMLRTHAALTVRTNRPRNLLKSNDLSEIGDH